VTLSLSAINRFPIKSCRGESLQHATVEPWGLHGDRRWMVVDEGGSAITAREEHALFLVHPEIVEGGLSLTRAGADALTVPTPNGSQLREVDVHGTPLLAASADDSAHAWFSAAIGRPATLVYLDDPTRRPTNPQRTLPSDRVSLADGYPLLLTTEASLAALNDLLPSEGSSNGAPLPMMRFRPNVVVKGGDAWDEDDWRRVRIGRAQFRAVKGCDRCVMTTLDPDTGKAGHEPIATLARHRRWDGKTWFGINLVPDTQGVSIGVGDEVEVLSAVEPGAGPLR
jgi:hypothetical protein